MKPILVRNFVDDVVGKNQDVVITLEYHVRIGTTDFIEKEQHFVLDCQVVTRFFKIGLQNILMHALFRSDWKIRIFAEQENMMNLEVGGFPVCPVEPGRANGVSAGHIFWLRFNSD